MKILFDTNILVHAHNRASQFHRKAADIIKKALQGEIEAYITPQILYEFFAVVINPRRVEYPLSVEEASVICLDLWECREIKKVNPTAITPMKVFNLIKRLSLSVEKFLTVY
jgi:predicted nucleic acid-binding protein